MPTIWRREAGDGRRENTEEQRPRSRQPNVGKPIRNFRDLEVYQQALNLVTRTYQTVDRLPENERYGLISQMRRAAVSIVANIAEGYGKKRSVKDFRAYLDTAVGSSNEMIALLDVCKELEYIDIEDWEKLSEVYTVLAKRISVLARNWR